MTSIASATARDLAEAWLRADPDPTTGAQTQALLEADGLELDAVFGTNLSFGTAGLRGPMRTGPSGMNRVLVRLAAAAVADTALAGDFGSATDPHIVVGFDARHGSAAFAADTARVALARGVRSTLLPEPRQTPVLAFAVTHLGATAGVMVTASHNPRTDNGYKVYGSDGALLTPPVDAAIAARLESLPLLHEEDLAAEAHIARADGALLDAYIRTVAAPYSDRACTGVVVAHTALHGVGRATLAAAFARAGFDAPHPVAAQADPDPDFPSAAFPNPEEPGRR